MRISKKVLITISLSAVLALTASACGDDDDDSDSADAPSASAQTATGAPINIGFMNTENSPVGSYPEIREATAAAVEYINTELGGVGGRPLAVENCVTDATPATSLACANKFVQSNKVAVIPGIEYGTAAALPPLTQAGIPYVGGLPLDSAELTAPNSFSFIGASPAALSALSTFIAQDLQAKKVGIPYSDIPVGKVAAETFGRTVLNNLGVTDITLVPESPAAADYTAALTKANEGDPDAMLVLFAGTGCSRIMQATQALGIPSEKMVYTQVCSAPDQLQTGGAGAENAYFNSPFLQADSDDPNVRAYLAAMEDYAPDTAPDQANAQMGFNSVMNLYNIVKKIQGDITPQAIIDALKATNNEPGFMSHPYTCNGQQIPNLPAVCNANERILQYKGGKFEDVKGDWVLGVANLAPR